MGWLDEKTHVQGTRTQDNHAICGTFVPWQEKLDNQATEDDDEEHERPFESSLQVVSSLGSPWILGQDHAGDSYREGLQEAPGFVAWEWLLHNLQGEQWVRL